MSGVAQQGRRPEWLPIGVGLACCLLIFGGLLIADRPAWSGATGWAAGRGTDFVPGDGQAVFAHHSGTVARGKTGAASLLGPPLNVPAGTMMIESARLPVVSAVQSVDRPLGQAVLRALDGTVDVPIWRTTSRPADSTAGPASTTGAAPTTGSGPVAFYRVDDGIALLASGDSSGIRSFAPALALLPADPRPGASWDTDGTVTSGATSARFTGRFRVVSMAQDCATVAGRLTVAGASGGTVQLTQTWCAGSGIAAQTVRTDGGSATMRTVVPPGPAREVRPAGPVARWQQSDDWQARSITPVTVRPDGRADPVQGTPADLAPVLTSTGVLVRVGQQGRDLVLLAPAAGSSPSGQWPVRGRLHPGGTPTTVIAAGSMIVVGTTERQLIGYDDHGVRRWRVGLDDIIAAPPIVVGRTLFAATLGGTVLAVDSIRGTVLWRHDVSDVVATSPAVAEGTVAVQTASADVIGLDRSTGAERWQVKREATGELIGIGSQVVVADGRAVHGYDAATGQHRWRRAVSSTVEQLVGLGSDILVRAHDDTSVLDPDGRLLATMRSYAAITENGSQWIGWRPGAADLYRPGPAGTAPAPSRPTAPTRSYPIPQLAGVSEPQLIAGGRGMLIFSIDWTFAELAVAG